MLVGYKFRWTSFGFKETYFILTYLKVFTLKVVACKILPFLHQNIYHMALIIIQ